MTHGLLATRTRRSLRLYALSWAVAITFSVSFIPQAWGLSEVGLLNPASPTNSPFNTGGPAAALDDTFSYDPNTNYADLLFLNSAVQMVDIPQTAYGGSSLDTFMSLQNGAINIGTDATNFLNVDVSLNPDQSFDFLDIWGRTDYGGPEEDRHQGLTITFFDDVGGSAGSGNVLGEIASYNGVTAKDASNTPGSAYGRLDITSILNTADRVQVRSFEIDHVGSDTFLLLQELRAASITGAGPGAIPVAYVNRASGEVELANDSIDGTPLLFSGYSIRSTANGVLAPDLWQSIADTGDADSGESIDPDDIWFELTNSDSTSDLSEVELPGGDGVSLGMGERLSLGNSWIRSSDESVLSVQLIGADDQVTPVEVRYVGTFLPGDYDFDEIVTEADYAIWKAQFGELGKNLAGDGNLDGVVDALDYVAWRDNLGAQVFSLATTNSTVPEPRAISLASMVIVVVVALRCQKSRVFDRLARPTGNLLQRSLVTATIGACLTVLMANSSHAQTFTPTGNVIVRLEKLVEGLNGDLTGNTANTRPQYIPIDMTPLGDGRQLILTLSGHVRLLQADGTLASGAYLDTTNSRTPSPNAQDFTQIGATSIAAHPGFSNPQSRGYGKFYTVTSEIANSGVTADFGLDLSSGGNYAVDSVVNEWTIEPSALASDTQLDYTPDNGQAQDTVSVREVLRSQRPGIIHTLADIAFDASENLLITSGDGGGNAFPNSNGSANGQDRETNSQDPTNIFGSILRIDPLDLPNDVRATGGVNGQYRIPTDNAFALDGDQDTPAEFFAYGFRSPYRMSIDQQTGTILIGDVGEASREEINSVTNGGNYGWGGFEGTRINRGSLASAAVDPIEPTFELYHNLGGQSEAVNIVGGFIYRGTSIPELQGKYIFADTGEDEFTQSTNVLDLYYGDPSTTDSSTRDDFMRLQLELPDGLPDRIWSLAEDENGELYALVGPQRIDLFNLDPGETDGGIWRILPAISQPLNGIAGDVNQDGVVNGNGLGLASEDDIAAFAAGWLSTGHETLFAQFTNGDLNLDGITDLEDWLVLKENHIDGANLSLADALTRTVPEPSSALLLVALVAISGCLHGRPRCGTHSPWQQGLRR